MAILNKEYFENKNSWLKLLENEKNEDAFELYFEKLMPAIIPLIKDRVGSLPKYNGLISLLGFTPETSVLAFKCLSPSKLVVLHTPETSKYLDTVLHKSNISVSSFFHEPFQHDESHIDDIYLALKKALNRFNPGDRIAIELTGGKKTMGAQLSIAAGVLEQNSGFKIDVCYIDYDKYLPQFRKPDLNLRDYY